MYRYKLEAAVALLELGPGSADRVGTARASHENGLRSENGNNNVRNGNNVAILAHRLLGTT
jgi:hypothetical protein